MLENKNHDLVLDFLFTNNTEKKCDGFYFLRQIMVQTAMSTEETVYYFFNEA